MNGDKLRRYAVGGLIALALILVGLDRLFRASGIGGITLTDFSRPATDDPLSSATPEPVTPTAPVLRIAVEWVRCKPAAAGYTEVSGSLRNLSSIPARHVRLGMEYRSADGSPAGAGIATPTPATIPAGARAVFTFLANAPDGSSAAVVSAETSDGAATLETAPQR